MRYLGSVIVIKANFSGYILFVFYLPLAYLSPGDLVRYVIACPFK
jgi:hypothetical protein